MPRPRPDRNNVAVPTSISLTAAQVAQLATLATTRETSISALVREALTAHYGPAPKIATTPDPRQPALFGQFRV